VIKSSEIEGENINREQVRSSIVRRLGMDTAGAVHSQRNIDGVVELMLDATQHLARPLTEGRLFDWHAALLPTSRSGMSRITVAAWRLDKVGPMQVVSGTYGREKVRCQAPAGGTARQRNGHIPCTVRRPNRLRRSNHGSLGPPMICHQPSV
jgi:Fic family protein